MKLNFVKINPSGNTTILVTSQVDKELHAEVAQKLLAYGSVQAEQVGFVSFSDPDDNPEQITTLSLSMMGGEFCGNATRSAAAYAVFAHLLEPDAAGFTYPLIQCSGASAYIPCRVRKTEDEAIYWAEGRMPAPITIEAAVLTGHDASTAANGTLPANIDATITVNTTKGADIPNMLIPATEVTLEGITHYIIDMDQLPAVKGLTPKAIFANLKEGLCARKLPAFGLIFVSRNTALEPDLPVSFHALPVVYVAGTDSVFWEQSCGSGTVALGAAWHAGLLRLEPAAVDSRELTVLQPGGSLTIRIAEEAGRPVYYLSGPIAIAATGEAFI